MGVKVFYLQNSPQKLNERVFELVEDWTGYECYKVEVDVSDLVVFHFEKIHDGEQEDDSQTFDGGRISVVDVHGEHVGFRDDLVCLGFGDAWEEV